MFTTRRISYFCSEVLSAVARYGMPTEQLEEAAERYRQGCRHFDYFKGTRHSSRPEQPVPAPSDGSTDTAGCVADANTGAGTVCKAELLPATSDPEGRDLERREVVEQSREQYVPTWKGLALQTECNIVRLDALKKMATSIYNTDGNEVMCLGGVG